MAYEKLNSERVNYLVWRYVHPSTPVLVILDAPFRIRNSPQALTLIANIMIDIDIYKRLVGSILTHFIYSSTLTFKRLRTVGRATTTGLGYS